MAGPFRVAEYRQGSMILLRRNPYYWKTMGGKRLPYLDAIRLDIQQNRSIEMSRFLAGELDVMDTVDPESFSRLAGRSGITAVDAGPSLDTEQMWFDQSPARRSPITRSDGSRRASSAARYLRRSIERTCAAWFLRRMLPAAAAHIPACNRTWVDNRLTPRPFDPAEARRLLESAGFRWQSGVMKDGGRHPVEYRS